MDTYLLLIAGLFAALGLSYMTGILQKALTFVYGEFTTNERNKFILYGSLFFLIIGVYWLLRCVKDSIFNSFIGSEYTMIAKLVSLVVVFPIVIGYSYLVDKFPRHRIFYVLSGIFATLFFGVALFLSSTVFGLHAPAADRWRLLGWFTYTLVETFGSLMPILFYSFMVDTTTPESGKKAFFVTATFGQLGAVFGSLLVSRGCVYVGVSKLVALAGCVTLCIPLVVSFIMWAIPKSEFIGYQAKGGGKQVDAANKKSKAGFKEGLSLMLSQPYLLGIFFVIWAFEVIVTIFDLQFKILIAEFAQGDPSVYATYAGGYGVWMGTLALAALLLGIGKVGRKIGLTLSLVFMPVCIIASVFCMAVSPVLSIAFWVMVGSKGINYALGQPSKEQLFIPTSRDAKYKAKTWTDMFGSRFSKASGAGVKLLQASTGLSLVFLMGASTIICIVWFFVAIFLGKTHKAAVDRNDIVC